MHLRFCYMTAMGCGENGHACIVMKQLEITYQQSTPQSMGDQFWFWNCENVPEKLPKYITELKVNPMECIGFGINKEDAEKIKNYKTNQTRVERR